MSAVFLLGSRTHINLQQFTHFTLNAQSASSIDRSTATMSRASPKRVGRFQLFSDALTKFNEHCVNTVSEADDLAKSEIQVMWVAPPTGSGCVAISAMVYESAEKWYADDGALTKIICQANANDIDAEKPVNECCACDEAKYSVSLKIAYFELSFLIPKNICSSHLREFGLMKPIRETIHSPFG